MADFTIEQWVDVATSEVSYNEREMAIIKDYAGSIDLGVYSLAELMKDMGPYIAQENDLVKVAKALKLLSPILNAIVAQPGLSHVHVFVEYLCARLENKDKLHNYRAGIREATSALQVLSTWRSFPPGDASVVVSAIFELSAAKTFKDQTPATRLELFNLIDYLVKNYGKPLERDMRKASLVEGIVSMALAEKNPSCLGVLFPLFAHVGRNWDLEATDFDNVWNSYIRYFPISVGNAVRDPSVPSQEKMRELLLKCIVSNDYYATKAFERLIDMLDTESDLSANTKKEVFSTLVSCIRGYSSIVIAKWTTKIWDALKFEVWNGDNEDFIDGSLKVLNALATALEAPLPLLMKDQDPLAPPRSYEWPNLDNSMAQYIVSAVGECKARISDSRRQYLQSSSKILKALASSSPYAFHLVTITILPTLLVIWQDVTLESEKKMLVDTFNGILESRLQYLRPTLEDNNSITSGKSIEAMKGSFAKFRNDLVELYFSLIPDIKALVDAAGPEKDTLLGMTAIRGLTLIFQVPSYLSLAEKNMVVTEIAMIALNKKSGGEVREHVLDALTEISATDPDVYQKTTLDLFASSLPGSLSLQKGQRAIEITLVQSILDDLVQISCTMHCRKESDMGRPLTAAGSFWHRNFDATVFKLLWMLDETLKHDQQQPYVQAVTVAICLGLGKFEQAVHRALLVSHEPPFPAYGQGPYNWIVKRLFRLILKGKALESSAPYVGLADLPASSIRFDDTTVDYVGQIAMMALRSPHSRKPHNDFVRTSYGAHALKTQNAQMGDQDLDSTRPKPSVIWTLFTENGDLAAISASQYKLEEGPEDKCSANLLSTYLLAGFALNEGEIKHGAQSVLHFDPGLVASTMIKNAISIQSKATRLGRMSMLWMIQLLVNKYRALDTASLCDLMHTIVSDSSPRSETETRYTLQTLAYLTAASLAALQPTSTNLVKLMVEGVANPKYGQLSAASFRILLAPSPIINKENFCILRPLRKAKLFHLAFQPLREMWTAGDRKTKDNALIALSGILGYIDSNIYTDGNVAGVLLPLILDGTNVTTDTWAKATFIKTLNNLVLHRSDLIKEYMKSVITRMTDRTHNTLVSPSDSDIVSRGLALEVLTNIVNTLPPACVLKEKTQLTTELNFALDDPSRDVRDRAQRCKTALLCLVEPSSDA